MTFALIFRESEAELSRRNGPDAPAYWGAWSAYIDMLDDKGALVKGAGAGLEGPEQASTVRVQAGERQIQDGPYPDTKEQIGGLVLVTAASRAEAEELAAMAPCASAGSVEVRPILPSPAE